MLKGISQLHKYFDKFIRSKLDPVKAQEILQIVTNFIKNEEVFKNNLIKLPSVAKELRISPHQISQVLNDYQNQNFCDFVNSFRITKAKKMLISLEFRDLTIAEIAYEVGFNSISAFNISFKRLTNTTPTSFKKKLSERLVTILKLIIKG